MLDCLVSGKLIRDPQIKTSSNGNQYVQFLMSVSTGEADSQIVSGIGFDESVVNKINLLKKGDSLCVAGSLKPSSWADKATGETKHGLSVTVNNSLSVYDIQKRRKPKPEEDKPATGKPSYNDEIDF